MESVAATPIAFVQAIVLAYEKYDIDPGALLRRAQITPAMLRAPSTRITAARFEAISGAAMQELDDEALGWFNRKLGWGSYGLLARASVTAPNLGIALKRWCRHHWLLTQDIELTLNRVGARASLTVSEQRPLGAMREFCLVSMLRNVHGFACWLVNSRIPLVESTFPFAAPAHADVYPLLFPSLTYFNSPLAGFSFDADYLTLPIRRDERSMRTMLQRALPLTVRQYHRDRLLMQRVRELLREQPATRANAEALANALNVSSRTLHRQLHEEGVSLQDLKDEVRRTEAENLLCRTDRPLKQIAAVLGFSDAKCFARAFRHWTGTAPGEFRRKAASGD